MGTDHRVAPYANVTLSEDRRLREHDDAALPERTESTPARCVWSDGAVQRKPVPHPNGSPFRQAMQTKSHPKQSTVSLKLCARESPLQSFDRVKVETPR